MGIEGMISYCNGVANPMPGNDQDALTADAHLIAKAILDTDPRFRSTLIMLVAGNISREKEEYLASCLRQAGMRLNDGRPTFPQMDLAPGTDE
jgi:hypothetical protein